MTVIYASGPPARALGAAAVAAALVTAASPLLAQPAAAASAITVNGCEFPDSPTFARHAYCPGVDLRGALLIGAELQSADLTCANLHGADLSRADLDGTDLSRADLDGVISGGITGTPRFLPEGWELVNGVLQRKPSSVFFPAWWAGLGLM